MPRFASTFLSATAAGTRTACWSDRKCRGLNCPVVNAVAAESNNMPLRSEIARFAFVGAINTAVDLAVLNTLIATTHRGRAGLLYSLFKAISFLVAGAQQLLDEQQVDVSPNGRTKRSNAGRPVLVCQRLRTGHQCRDCIIGGALRRTCEMASEMVALRRGARRYRMWTGSQFCRIQVPRLLSSSQGTNGSLLRCSQRVQ